MAKISLCMIAKDEEKNLGRCLGSVKGLVDEIIVVDTGSTDNTVKIAKKHNAKVFHFEWRDDFANARNESLKHATGDWILVLDADEIIAEEDFEKVRRITENPDSAEAYTMEIRSYHNSPKPRLNSKPCDSSKMCKGYDYYGVSLGVRLFRNKGYRYRYPVHEEISESVVEAGGDIKNSGIPLHHYGYSDERQYKDKARKWREILRKECGKDANVKVKYDLAMMEYDAGNYEKAARILSGIWEEEPGYRLTPFMLAQCHKALNENEKAIEWYRKQIEMRPENPNAYINLGLLHSKKGNLEKASRAYCDLLNRDPENFFAYKNLFALYLKFKKHNYAHRVAKTAFERTGHDFFREQLSKFKKQNKD